jgi:putative ABC transport system permease protein
MLYANWSNKIRQPSALALAIVLTMTILTCISQLESRIAQLHLNQASESLAAPLVVEGSRPIQTSWKKEAENQGILHSSSIELSSMIRYKKHFHLVGIKTIDARYPLTGTLTNQHGKTFSSKPGTVIFDQSLASLFNLKPQTAITVNLGQAKFTVSDNIASLTELKKQFFSFMPTVLLHQQDLAKTKLIQPGSRVYYKDYFQSSNKNIKQLYDRWLKNKRSDQRLRSSWLPQTLGLKWLLQGQQTLAVTLCLMLCLAGICLAMHAQHFIQSERRHIALMRCIGVPWPALIRHYSRQTLRLSLSAAAAGWILGLLLTQGLSLAIPTMETLPTATITSLIRPLADCGLLMLAFLIPPFYEIKKIKPLLALNDAPNLLYLKAKDTLCGLASICLLIMLHSNLWRMPIALISGLLLLYLLLSNIGRTLLRILAKSNLSSQPPWILALQRLQLFEPANRAQIVALSTTFAAWLTLILLSHNLMQHSNTILKSNKPNFFVINIHSQQKQAFASWLHKNKISYESIYPMVKGRIILRDNKPFTDSLPDADKQHFALNRDLNLSSFSQLAENNHLVQGNWFADKDLENVEVSVEEKLAKQLHITLKQKLGFQIGPDILTATVTSLRAVTWNSMQPNFFMIFSKNALKPFAKTYITSFYLAKTQYALLPRLLHAFPNITLLDLADIGKKVMTAFQQLHWLVNILLLTMSILGLAVLSSAISQNTLLRKHQSILLYRMGISNVLQRQANIMEYLLMGLIITILGYGQAWLFLELVIENIFNFEIIIPWTASLGSGLIAWLLIVFIGHRSTALSTK